MPDYNSLHLCTLGLQQQCDEAAGSLPPILFPCLNHDLLTVWPLTTFRMSEKNRWWMGNRISSVHLSATVYNHLQRAYIPGCVKILGYKLQMSATQLQMNCKQVLYNYAVCGNILPAFHKRRDQARPRLRAESLWGNIRELTCLVRPQMQGVSSFHNLMVQVLCMTSSPCGSPFSFNWKAKMLPKGKAVLGLSAVKMSQFMSKCCLIIAAVPLAGQACVHKHHQRVFWTRISSKLKALCTASMRFTDYAANMP